MVLRSRVIIFFKIFLFQKTCFFTIFTCFTRFLEQWLLRMWTRVVNCMQEVEHADGGGGGEDLSQEVGDVLDFAIVSTHPDTLQQRKQQRRTHRGRIERVPLHELTWPACESDDGLVLGSHRLWVDDCHIPEYTDNDLGGSSAAYYDQV